MPGYGTVIAEAIAAAGYPGHTDNPTVALVEDCMRTNRTGLGHLTREAFSLEVALIIEDLTSHPAETRTLCRMLGFATPAWLDDREEATVLPWPATCRHIAAALTAAFPGTRFTLTNGHGQGRGYAVVRWTDGPARSSVTDVLAQFLPGHGPNQPRYGLVAIFPCRVNGLDERIG